MVLQNKVVLITGASRGIGKSIASKLGENGARIVLISRNEDELAKLNDEFSNKNFKSIYKSADVSISQDFINVVEYAKTKWNTVDALINNAGITDDNLIVPVIKAGDRIHEDNFINSFNIVFKS